MKAQGIVVRGKGEARGLGYPTANLEYTSDEPLLPGVWACWATVDGQRHQAAAVIGMWQEKNGEPSLEIHLLDYQDDVYDQTIQVEFLSKLRDLDTFLSMDELVAQIEKDIQDARVCIQALSKV